MSPVCILLALVLSLGLALAPRSAQGWPCLGQRVCHGGRAGRHHRSRSRPSRHCARKGGRTGGSHSLALHEIRHEI